MICDECETVAHCLKNGCVPKQPSKDEALKLALEALGKARSRIVEAGGSGWKLEAQRCVNAITAIKQALLTATPLAAPVPDIPDLIAGALGVSRGTAYDLIREALKEAAPVQEQVAAELERIAQEPPVNGNNLAQARVLMAAQRIRNAIPPNVATPLDETASLAAPVHFAWMRYEADCAGDPVLVLARSTEEGAFKVYKEPPAAQPAPVQQSRSDVEPVAWVVEDEHGERLEWAGDAHSCHGLPTLPLYTTPPAQSALKPLTDEQIESLLPDDDTPMSLGEAFVKFARLVEAAHGITEKGQP